MEIFVKTILRPGIAAVGLLAITGAFIHPFGQIKAQRTSEPLLSGAETPREIARVFERSCQNCHSERTEWPWYSYVPPSSWFIESDVYQARTHMNLSLWRDYTFDQQVEILTELGAEVRGRQMPPSRYVFLHPEARLSDAEVEQLYEWAHRERRRLRSSAEPGTE
jgi:heme-binding protein